MSMIKCGRPWSNLTCWTENRTSNKLTTASNSPGLAGFHQVSDLDSNWQLTFSKCHPVGCRPVRGNWFRPDQTSLSVSLRLDFTTRETRREDDQKIPAAELGVVVLVFINSSPLTAPLRYKRLSLTTNKITPFSNTQQRSQQWSSL